MGPAVPGTARAALSEVQAAGASSGDAQDAGVPGVKWGPAHALCPVLSPWPQTPV